MVNSGLCLRADPLVAEDAAEFVDLLDPADEQPLQRQFQGDAQEEVDVEGVVVRLERPRRGAAGDGVQRRRFHFHVAESVEVVADGADDASRAGGPGGACPACRSCRGSGAAAGTRSSLIPNTSFGCGSSDFVRNVRLVTWMVSSPVLVLPNSPSTPIRSPRSRSCASFHSVSVSLLTRTINWTRPVWSQSSRKSNLPPVR